MSHLSIEDVGKVMPASKNTFQGLLLSDLIPKHQCVINIKPSGRDLGGMLSNDETNMFADVHSCIGVASPSSEDAAAKVGQPETRPIGSRIPRFGQHSRLLQLLS